LFLSKDLLATRAVVALMEYKLKRGFSADPERILSAIREEFPVEVSRQQDRLSLSYGALRRIEVWVENKKLNVVTESDPGASDAIVLDSNKRFRNFLEKATGYSAKQRLQMAKKEVQGQD